MTISRTATAPRRALAMLAAGFVLMVGAPAAHADDEPAIAESMNAARAEAAAALEASDKPVELKKFTKSRRVASKPRKARVVARGVRRKAIEANSEGKAADKVVPMSEADTLAMPETVANANAKWQAPETAPAFTQQMPRVGARPDAPTVVASDELSDLDRSLNALPAAANGNDAGATATRVAAAAVADDARVAPALPVAAEQPAVSRADDSRWDQASLIGKIFIALGGLLTLASAARMFMA